MASNRIILLVSILTLAGLAGNCFGKNLMNAEVTGRIGDSPTLTKTVKLASQTSYYCSATLMTLPT